MSKFPKGLVHDFPQKYENSSQSHFLWKIPTHDFNNVLNETKKVFQTTKMSFQNAGKMSTFPKGSSHDFPQTFKVLTSLILSSRHMFYNALNKKKGSTWRLIMF